MDDMAPYYRERAPVYDRVYQYPERQLDLRFLESHVMRLFENCRVLEVAAGTGYWTQFLSQSARSILAVDREQAQLDELNRRDFNCPVETRVQDVYHLDRLVDEGRSFTGAFAGLWLSHVPRQRLKEFFCSLHQCLRPGSTVLLIDNSPAQLAQFPIKRKDEYGNTYQHRTLDSGATHEVLKNFPNLEELRAMTEPFGDFQNYVDLENFWLFQYRHRR